MKKTDKRDHSILIKVTQQEKKHVAQNAKEFGGTMSEFARERLLHPDSSSIRGAQMQDFVCALCRFTELIKKVNDAELRHKLEEGIENLWRSIK